MRYNQEMGWLLPIGIWAVIAFSFMWAGREAQRLRETARRPRPRPTPRRRSFGGWAGLEAVDVEWTAAEPPRGPGRPRRASWDLATLPPATRSAEHPSISTRHRYAWETDTTSDRGQYN